MTGELQAEQFTKVTELGDSNHYKQRDHLGHSAETRECHALAEGQTVSKDFSRFALKHLKKKSGKDQADQQVIFPARTKLNTL